MAPGRVSLTRAAVSAALLLVAGATAVGAQEPHAHGPGEGETRVAPKPAGGVLAFPEPTGRVLAVGPAGPHRSIGAALSVAFPGDSVRVAPGTYRERLRIEVAVFLVGEGRPVLDGGGDGHVVEALAPLSLRGFAVRGSGDDVEREHAGVMVRDAVARIEDNAFEDVFYGIYLKNAAGSTVRANRIRGKPFPPARRGDGIRLWYSSGARILDNDVRGMRDVVVYFSDSLLVRGNAIRDSRYGLHYMYSNHNAFEENVFEDNQVGAFIMYSADVGLRDNVFASGGGASGMGLGLKDADGIRAEGNLFLENASGIYLDNSPRTRSRENVFARNLLLGNGSGVRLLPSVSGNAFLENDFVLNERPVTVSGGTGRGQAGRNAWRGNAWSTYAGFDRDEDGVGDTPFVHARLTDALLSSYEELKLFAYSPAMPVIETVSRFFPLLRPEPLAVDSAPAMRTRSLEGWASSPPVPVRLARTDGSGRWVPVWAAGALVALGAAWRLGGRRRT